MGDRHAFLLQRLAPVSPADAWPSCSETRPSSTTDTAAGAGLAHRVNICAASPYEGHNPGTNSPVDNSVSRLGETPGSLCTSCGELCGEKRILPVEIRFDRAKSSNDPVGIKLFRVCVERWCEAPSPVYKKLDSEARGGIRNARSGVLLLTFFCRSGALVKQLWRRAGARRHRMRESAYLAATT